MLYRAYDGETYIFRYILSLLFTLGLNLTAVAQESKESWNALIFTQQWPITSCIEHMQREPSASCNLFPNMTSWGVHGLWPTDSGKMGPNFCNNSWHFIEGKIGDIEPYLLKYWPNIFGEKSTTSLWKHEWMKHGTCAAEVEDLDSEHKYFLKGINLLTYYDLVAILGGKQIYPNDEKPYKRDDIVSAIKYAVHKNPIIDCAYNSKEKKHELSQIKLCFNRLLQLISCDEIGDLRELSANGNCPESAVFYPSSVKTNNRTYRYTKSLALEHTLTWVEAHSCSSWLCKALKMVKSLSLLTF